MVRDLWHFHLLLICLRCGLVQTLNQRITENPTWKPFSKKKTLLSSIIKRFLRELSRSRSPSVTEGRDLTGGGEDLRLSFSHLRQDHARWQLCFGNNSTHFQLFTNVLQNDSIESVGLFAIWLQMKWVDWLLSKKIWSQFGGPPQLEAQPQRCAGFSAVFNPVSQYASMQCATLREVEKVNKGTTVRALLLFLAHITQPCPLSPN